MVKREVGKVHTKSDAAPATVYKQKFHRDATVFTHGKVMTQVNATYKPGDRPESLIRYSGGLSAKVTV